MEFSDLAHDVKPEPEMRLFCRAFGAHGHHRFEEALFHLGGLALRLGKVNQLVAEDGVGHDLVVKVIVEPNIDGNALHAVATTPEEKILASRLGSPNSKPPA